MNVYNTCYAREQPRSKAPLVRDGQFGLNLSAGLKLRYGFRVHTKSACFIRGRDIERSCPSAVVKGLTFELVALEPRPQSQSCEKLAAASAMTGTISVLPPTEFSGHAEALSRQP